MREAMVLWVRPWVWCGAYGLTGYGVVVWCGAYCLTGYGVVVWCGAYGLVRSCEASVRLVRPCGETV